MQQTPRSKVIHPWPLRIMHWLNAAAVIMLIGSGWQIYDASPLFDFTFPPLLTIGRWLGAGIAWLLAFIWLLIGNGALYLIWGTVTGHFRRRLWPLSPRLALQEMGAAIRFTLPHEHGVYTAVQKLLYIGVIFAGILIVLSGCAIWKPVQLWPLTDLFGGYVIARYVHFFAMAGIATFLAVHILLVILVPRVLPPMVFGGKTEDVKS
jgi:thiosulfate reductase cytochrome b subunit